MMNTVNLDQVIPTVLYLTATDEVRRILAEQTKQPKQEAANVLDPEKSIICTPQLLPMALPLS